MNPFTESTVAHALPKNQRASYWRRRRPDAPAEPAPEGAGRPAPSSSGTPPPPQPVSAAFKRMRTALSLGVAVLLFATMPAQAHAVDVNNATVQELLAVRGIGPKTAQAIVDERVRGGRYASLTDLSDRVKGIGPKKAATLQAAGLKADAGDADKASTAKGAAPAAGTSGARR